MGQLAGKRKRTRRDQRKAESNAARDVALLQLDRMERLEAKIRRRGRPGSIHDFRVASRRFEQAFELSILPDSPALVRRLTRKVAKARKALSPVRDCDVVIARGDTQLATSGESARNARAALDCWLRKRRAKSYVRAVRKLHDLRFGAVCSRIRRAIEPRARNPKRNLRRSANPLGAAAFRERLRAELERVLGNYHAATRAAADRGNTRSLHKLRVAVKRLRYLVEITESPGDQPACEALEILRASQQALGEWHDLEIQSKLLGKARHQPEWAHGIRKLLVETNKGIARTTRRKDWPISRGQTRRLEQCLAEMIKLAHPEKLHAPSRRAPKR